MLLRHPDKFKCQWCNNTILALTWKEILSMLYTYREVVGCHAFNKISTETQIPVTSLTQYILYGHTPNYDTGRRLGLFLQEEFQNMPRDVIIVFDEKYPHIK